VRVSACGGARLFPIHLVEYWMNMRARYRIGVLLILPALWAPLLAGAGSWEYMANTRISWRNYDADTLRLARQTGKPLFILIYADWCQWCQKYEQESLETDIVRQHLMDHYIPVAVDYDKQPEIARRLKARIVPTSLLLTPDGGKLLRFYGFIDAAGLADTLEQVLVQWRRGELPDEDFGDPNTCCPLDDGAAGSAGASGGPPRGRP